MRSFTLVCSYIKPHAYWEVLRMKMPEGGWAPCPTLKHTRIISSATYKHSSLLMFLLSKSVIPGRLFHVSLMFVSKVGAYPS
jgi:hypothetical protein